MKVGQHHCTLRIRQKTRMLPRSSWTFNVQESMQAKFICGNGYIGISLLVGAQEERLHFTSNAIITAITTPLALLSSHHNHTCLIKEKFALQHLRAIQNLRLL